MVQNVHKVAFVRDDRKISLKSQRAAAEAAGITRVYADLAMLVRQRRKGLGDVVAVRRLHLLADPSARRRKGGLRQSMWNAIDAIEATGSSIFELDTLLSSLRQDERDAMIRAALDTLAQTRERSDKIGRPPTPRAEDDLRVMREHWFSTRHATNRDAIAAMDADGLKTTASVVGKLLGPSGRLPGTR